MATPKAKRKVDVVDIGAGTAGLNAAAGVRKSGRNWVLVEAGLTTIAKLLRPGDARAIIADSLLTKQQLLIINRSRRRSPKLTALDRFLMGFCSLFLLCRNIRRAAVVIQPSTLLKFHQLLKHCNGLFQKPIDT